MRSRENFSVLDRFVGVIEMQNNCNQYRQLSLAILYVVDRHVECQGIFSQELQVIECGYVMVFGASESMCVI